MHCRRQKGFTLVEMCIVLGILGLLFATAVLGTSRLLRSHRLVGATNTLVSDLRYARVLATTQRRNFQIVFESGGYSVVRAAPPDTILRRQYPSGVSCTSSDAATFYAWGLAAPVTVTLANTSGSSVVQLSSNGNITRE